MFINLSVINIIDMLRGTKFLGLIILLTIIIAVGAFKYLFKIIALE